jgi:Coenzyme PQQ synthesis protein D (PqqD)
MLTISKAIRRTQTQDGGILLDVERGRMFCLNAVGSKILELLDTGCDEPQIAARVSATCDADSDTVRVDVHDFLLVLSNLHIIEHAGPCATSKSETADGSRYAT